MIFLFTLSAFIVLVVGSSIGQQKSLAVTIYNDNFAMIKDVRQIDFQSGQSTLFFNDVSANIQTQTVTFKAINNTNKIRVYEQNFEKNLVNKDSILKKYIEKEIDVYVGFGQTIRKVKGTLLGYNSGYILKTVTGIEVFKSVEGFQFPSLPDGFFTTPTLTWKVYSQQPTKTDCQVAYRTTGFKWKSDYSVILNAKEDQADIGGWVTIDNNSGKKYVNAKLKLIAGEVNVVSNRRFYEKRYRSSMIMQDSLQVNSAPQFTEKSFADYHLYTLSQPVTLNQQSQKQVQFIPKVYGVKVRKYHQITINSGGYSQMNLQSKNKIEFANSKDSGLGIPFPKGTVRVFKEDESDKSLQFIGEDSINHTPKDQKITLTTGNAFDITANKFEVQKRQYYRGSYDATMNLTITNHKNTDVEIQVKLQTGYHGNNLKIEWQSQIKLIKESGQEYVFTKILKADQNYTFKWKEIYTAP